MNEGTVVNVPDQLTGVYRELGVGGGEEEEQGGGNLFPDFRKVRRERFLKEIACGPLVLIKVLDCAGQAHE